MRYLISISEHIPAYLLVQLEVGLSSSVTVADSGLI
jgi:hypothetical protein